MNRLYKWLLVIISSFILLIGCGSESDQDKLATQLKLISNYSNNIDKNYNHAMGLINDVSTGALTLSEAGSAMSESAKDMDSFIVLIANASVEKSKTFENSKVKTQFAQATEHLWQSYKLKYNFVSDVSMALSTGDIRQINNVTSKHNGFGNQSKVLMLQAMAGYIRAKKELGMDSSLEEFK